MSERWNVTRAYRVAVQRGAASDPMKCGEPDLVELHEEVSETVTRKEELELSEADKVSAPCAKSNSGMVLNIASHAVAVPAPGRLGLCVLDYIADHVAESFLAPSRYVGIIVAS